MQNYKTTAAGQAVARKYADILSLARPDTPESRLRHPRMPLENRAKIFSPFAALRGYDDTLAEVRAEQTAPPPPDDDPYLTGEMP